MAGLFNTVFAATVTAVAVTIGTSATVSPRLAARSKRIQAAHDARDCFNDTVVQILALCALLAEIVEVDDWPDEMAARIRAERDRWLEGLDQATRWLIDNVAVVGGTYLGVGRTQEAAVRYAIVCRILWLSDRPVEDRVRWIGELTAPVQTFYFASLPLTLTKKMASLDALLALLDAYQGRASEQGPGVIERRGLRRVQAESSGDA